MKTWPGLALEDSIVTRIGDLLEGTGFHSVCPYPWSGIETSLRDRGESSLRVLGYGSLVNRDSAGLTLDTETMETRRAAVCFGVRRIFNYKMPPLVKRYGPPVVPDARAALNAEHTGKLEDVVNGVVMDVALEDIERLREREWGYDLVPAPTLRWGHFEGEPFIAYVLCVSRTSDLGKSIIDDGLTPHHEYYRQCRRGAADIGTEFLELWLASTYLGDGKTPVAEWEDEAMTG